MRGCGGGCGRQGGEGRGTEGSEPSIFSFSDFLFQRDMYCDRSAEDSLGIIGQHI